MDEAYGVCVPLEQTKPDDTIKVSVNEDQDLYRLHYTEGYSQEEIAEMKGVSQNTVSKKLRRIKKQLTEMCRKAV